MGRRQRVRRLRERPEPDAPRNRAAGAVGGQRRATRRCRADRARTRGAPAAEAPDLLLTVPFTEPSRRRSAPFRLSTGLTGDRALRGWTFQPGNRSLHNLGGHLSRLGKHAGDMGAGRACHVPARGVTARLPAGAAVLLTVYTGRVRGAAVDAEPCRSVLRGSAGARARAPVAALWLHATPAVNRRAGHPSGRRLERVVAGRSCPASCREHRAARLVSRIPARSCADLLVPPRRPPAARNGR